MIRPRYATALTAATIPVVSLWLSSSSAWAQSGLLTPLVMTSQAYPGAPSLTIANLNLNSSGPGGQVIVLVGLAGSGVTTSNDLAYIRYGGVLPGQSIVREGQVVSTPATFLNGAFDVNIFGTAVFNCTLTNTPLGTADNSGVYTTTNGTSFTQIVREGTTFTSGVTYLSFGAPRINDAGRLLFTGVLSGSDVTTANDSVLLTSIGGTPSAQIREGSATSFGGTWGPIDRASSFNSRGQALFQNQLVGVTNAQRFFIIDTSVGVSFTQALAAGDSVPGGGEILSVTQQSDFSELSQFAVVATLTNTPGGTTDNRGVYRASAGDLVQIARLGQAAPGGGTLASVSNPVISSTGRVALLATQSGSVGGTLDGSTIFTGTGSTLTRIIRDDQIISPGTYIKIGTPEAINAAGVVFFYGETRDVSSNAGTGFGYFLSDGVDLISAAFTGGVVDTTTINTIYGNGGPRRLLDDGRVITFVSLADGRDAVVQFTPSLRYRSTFSSAWDTSTNWTLSLTPSAVHDVRIDPATSLTVTGPTAAVTVKSLRIGGGTGTGALRLAGGTITAINGVSVTPTGALTGEGILSGAVNNSGVITPTNLTIASASLVNSGVIRASVPGTTTYPTLTASLTNTSTGEVRAVAGEYLRISGAHVRNQGRIEVQGLPTAVTQIEFEAPVTNVASTGLITARSGTLRFDASLLNQGSMALTSGINEIVGDVSNAAGGSINVTGGAQVTFYDDVTQNGTLRVSKVGSTTSVAVFLGSFSGSGGFTGGGDVFLEGDLRPGNSPAAVSFGGNASFGSGLASVMEIAGTSLGQYDRVDVTGQLSLGGTLDVTFIDGFAPATGAPMDFILFTAAGGITGDFTSIALPDLGGRQWNVFRTPTAYGITTSSVVPEPEGFALAGVPFAVALRRRRRTVR